MTISVRSMFSGTKDQLSGWFMERTPAKLLRRIKLKIPVIRLLKKHFKMYRMIGLSLQEVLFSCPFKDWWVEYIADKDAGAGAERC